MSKNKTRTKDKYRVVYNDTQRIELENEFRLNEYIAIPRKQEIASKLQLSERQIKIWFQNRRAKKRKQQKRKQSAVSTTTSANGNTTSSSPISTSSSIASHQAAGNTPTSTTTTPVPSQQHLATSNLRHNHMQQQHQQQQQTMQMHQVDYSHHLHHQHYNNNNHHHHHHHLQNQQQHHEQVTQQQQHQATPQTPPSHQASPGQPISPYQAAVYGQTTSYTTQAAATPTTPANCHGSGATGGHYGATSLHLNLRPSHQDQNQHLHHQLPHHNHSHHHHHITSKQQPFIQTHQVDYSHHQHYAGHAEADVAPAATAAISTAANGAIAADQTAHELYHHQQAHLHHHPHHTHHAHPHPQQPQPAAYYPPNNHLHQHSHTQYQAYQRQAKQQHRLSGSSSVTTSPNDINSQQEHPNVQQHGFAAGEGQHVQVGGLCEEVAPQEDSTHVIPTTNAALSPARWWWLQGGAYANCNQARDQLVRLAGGQRGRQHGPSEEAGEPTGSVTRTCIANLG